MAAVETHIGHAASTLAEIKTEMHGAREKVDKTSRSVWVLSGGIAVIAFIAPFIAKMVLG